MPNFIATKEAPAYEKADDSSKQLGTLHEGQIIRGDIEDGFVKTQIDGISAAPVFFDTLEDVQEISLSPEPIVVEDLSVFCAMVTKAARACGTDRDYLMAVAYSGTKNLQDLGQESGKRVGPFQFSEEEWKAATMTGPAKDRHFLPEERFQWSSQPEVAALLAAERTRQLKDDAMLGRDPTFAELYFAQLFGPAADKTLKLRRTDPCPAPAAGTFAADLALASGSMSIEAVLTGLQERLAAGYAEALKVIDEQPPEIRIFRVEDQADPPWLAVARNEQTRGVSETSGGRNSEAIEEYFKAINSQGSGVVAWCGAFAAFCMKTSGISEVENSVTPASTLAAWWRGWGKPADDPHRIGTVVVLKEIPGERSGHVGFLVGESDGKIQLLAGNQGKGQTGADHVGVVSFDREKEEPVYRWLGVPSMGTTIGGLDARSLHQKGVQAQAGDTLFIEKAPSVMTDLMRDFDLTKVHAAAILGNIGQECGGFTLFHQRGMPENEGGYGWCQWDGPRRRAFFKFADDNGLDRQSDEANYGFLKYELTKTSERQVLTEIKKHTTLEGAVKTFNDVFERSGKPMMNKRINYAQLALDAYENRLARS